MHRYRRTMDCAWALWSWGIQWRIGLPFPCQTPPSLKSEERSSLACRWTVPYTWCCIQTWIQSHLTWQCCHGWWVCFLAWCRGVTSLVTLVSVAHRAGVTQCIWMNLLKMLPRSTGSWRCRLARRIPAECTVSNELPCWSTSCPAECL